MSKVVRIFATDDEIDPVATFQSGVTVSQILESLHLSGGGLKVKGGPNIFVPHVAEGDFTLVGSIAKHFSVVLNEYKMVVPLTLTPVHKVFHLMDEIVRRFARFNTNPNSELRIAELRTGGFLLHKYDRVVDVLSDGSVVEAVDWFKWKDEQIKLCKTNWLSVERRDFSDDVTKWLIIGRHNHNKLYLMGGTGRTTDRLELFEIDDLTDFGKEGKQPVLSLKGKNGDLEWTIGASFVIVKGRVTSVEIEVKSCSDLRPEIRVVELDLSSGSLAQGKVEVVQSADQPPAAVEFPIPQDKREGPIFVVGEASEATSFTAVNWGGLKIETADAVDADQTWARDGVFENRFYINFNLTNTTDKSFSILKLSAQFQKGDEWVTANTVALGNKNGYYHYSWDWNNTYVRVEPHCPAKMAVLVGINVKAAQYDRNRRAHNSLPDPLNLRITLEDDQGNTQLLNVQYKNKPLDLPSMEKQKLKNEGLVYFLPVDDIETETRHYFAIEKKTENEETRLEMKASCSSSTYYYYQWNFNRLAFLASKEGKNEIEMEDFAFAQNGTTVKVYALVDLVHHVAYALKIVLQTNTSSVEGFYKIPSL